MKFARFFIFICLMTACSAPQANNANVTDLQRVSEEGLSVIRSGAIVRFTAMLVRPSSDSDCIELFTLDDFARCGGDGKCAISSKLTVPPVPTDFVNGSRPVRVSGYMTFIRDHEDTRKTCGITTGELFEIAAIEPITDQ